MQLMSVIPHEMCHHQGRQRWYCPGEFVSIPSKYRENSHALCEPAVKRFLRHVGVFTLPHTEAEATSWRMSEESKRLQNIFDINGVAFNVDDYKSLLPQKWLSKNGKFYYYFGSQVVLNFVVYLFIVDEIYLI